MKASDESFFIMRNTVSYVGFFFSVLRNFNFVVV